MQDEARRVDHTTREASPEGGPVGELEAELQLVTAALPSPRERGRPGGSDALKIEASVAVGTRERVVMVRAADTYLVLGVAPGQVRTLHVLDSPPQSFRAVMQQDEA